MKLPKKKLEIKYPKEFIRIDDNEIFYRAKDGFYYNQRMVLDFPNHLHNAWGYDAFLDTKFFKPIY